MSSTTDPHGARQTEDDRARTAASGRERTLRTPLARRLAAVSAGVLAIAALAALNAGSATSAASPTAVAGTRQPAPMIPSRRRAHRITRATIGMFTATPAQLPAAGGFVRLVAVVQGASSCRFSSSKSVGRLPASKPCASGTVSIAVKLPKNTRSSSRSFRFQLTASDAHSSTMAGPVWVTERAPQPAHGAPQVTTQPTGRSVAAGTAVSFTAAASGSPSVHWQVSSDGGQHWSNVHGATSDSYTFTATLAQSGHEYRAVFANSAGSARSDPAVLTVTAGSSGNAAAQIAPTVTLQPTGQNVTAGSVVTFTAAASGSPAPGVQWQVSADGGGSWTPLLGATGASYALTATPGLSGYSYRAVFANAAGTATSAAATLTVSVGPSMTIQPGNQSIVIGSGVTFTAAATGSPAPAVQWRVSGDGGASWAPIAGATSTSYSFTPALSDSGKQYDAVFSNGAGTITSNAATLTITQTSQAPAVTQQPLGQTVTAGAAVTFNAAASGSPTPSVKWQVSTDFGSTFNDIAGATSTSYTFTASQGQNGYEYRAVFSNGVGTAAITNPASLIVQSVPQITAQPSSTTVSAGTIASFSASATGVPAPTIQWQFSTDGGNTWSNAPGQTSNSYSFTALQGQNGSRYRAVFTNAAGSTATSAATLTVIAGAMAPQITGQPSSRAVVSGTSVTFSASASGTPTPTVQWNVSMDHGGTWSPVANATSSILAFTTAANENGWEYEAVFTNPGGTATTSAATLVVGADASSNNWSGYAATASAGTFTAVAGTWSVPVASCQGTTTFSSAWVGIDGDGSPTVEQDGTDSDCSNGSPNYYAWFETYGPSNSNPPVANGNSVTISPQSFPVGPGDSMTGTVSVSGNVYTLAITNNTRAWTFSVPETWSAPQRSSAEWVVERPQVNGSLSSLTNFGAVSFTASTATTSGSPLSIAALGGAPIQMTNAAVTNVLALPGALAPGGQGFTDTFYGSN